MDFRDVLIKPVITEKSMEATQNNKYTFIVNLKANKSQIKEAIEKIFKVKVIKVNSMKIIGKWKRVGKNIGKTSDRKKAIITLKKGNTIEIFQNS